MNQTFPRNIRLRGHRLITQLFKQGKSLYEFPFKLTWLLLETDRVESIQVLMSVPKYNFRKAVTRNLLKRRMKESFRINKHLLMQLPLNPNQRLLVCMTYTGKEILEFAQIQQKIILILQRLLKENEKVTG